MKWLGPFGLVDRGEYEKVVAQRDALAEIGQKILAKLESETASVTALDAAELRAAIATLEEER